MKFIQISNFSVVRIEMNGATTKKIISMSMFVSKTHDFETLINWECVL